MYEAKTKQTDASVAAYIDAIEDPQRREDCWTIAELMGRVTDHEAKLWGKSIVGFGSYHYKYNSGHEGDACLVGFSSRKAAISLYVMGFFENRDRLLLQFGKHRSGVGCIYIKRLADVDVAVLEKLVAESVADLRRRYP